MNSMGKNFGLKDEIREYWSSRAATFDDSPSHKIEDRFGMPEWHKLIRRECQLGNRDLKGWNVLDIACGTGEISRMLTDLGASVTGLDFSEAMLARARVKLADRDWRYVQADAESMAPLSDEHFDLAITRHLAWTLTDPLAAYAEWFRVLKPGGRLLIVDGNFRMAKGVVLRLRNWIADRLNNQRSRQGDRTKHIEILDQLTYADGLTASRLEADLRSVGFRAVRRVPVAALYGKGMRGQSFADRLRLSKSHRFALLAIRH